MRDISEKYWEYFDSEQTTFRILNMMHDSFTPGPQEYCIAYLYKVYRLGSWNNHIPAPDSLEDKELLFQNDRGISIWFHKQHEKFGRHILEWSDINVKNQFAFIDYASVEPNFIALNQDECGPYIPMYYAHPHDRTDYKAGLHQWQDSEL